MKIITYLPVDQLQLPGDYLNCPPSPKRDSMVPLIVARDNNSKDKNKIYRCLTPDVNCYESAPEAEPGTGKLPCVIVDDLGDFITPCDLFPILVECFYSFLPNGTGSRSTFDQYLGRRLQNQLFGLSCRREDSLVAVNYPDGINLLMCFRKFRKSRKKLPNGTLSTIIPGFHSMISH